MLLKHYRASVSVFQKYCRNCQITAIKTFLKRSKAPLRTLKERLTLRTQGGCNSTDRERSRSLYVNGMIECDFTFTVKWLRIYKRKLIMMDLIERLIKKRSSFSVLYVRRYFNRKEHSYTHFVIFIYRIFRVSIRLLIYKKEDPVWLIFLRILLLHEIFSLRFWIHVNCLKRWRHGHSLSLSQKAKDQLKRKEKFEY